MSSNPIEQDPSSTQTFGVADVVNSVDSPVGGVLSQQDAAAIAAPTVGNGASPRPPRADHRCAVPSGR